MATAQRTPENLAYHIIDSNWPQATSAAKKFIGMKTKVLVADSIEELAKKMGADPKAFVSLVNEFNTTPEGGKLKEMDPPCSLPEVKPRQSSILRIPVPRRYYGDFRRPQNQ